MSLFFPDCIKFSRNSEAWLLEMVKKKILFCLEALNCGGIESSAVTFLQALDSALYDVTLCLNRPGGDLLPQIPNWVKVQVLPYGPMEVLELTRGRKAVVMKLLSRGRVISALRWIIFGMKLRAMTSDQRAIATQRRRYGTLHPDQTVYDLAISYCRKAVWMHTELSPTWADVRTYLRFFHNMDYIYCVSPSLTESYKKVLPECVDRIREFHHVVNAAIARIRADEEKIDWPVGANGLRILSVGRLAYQKGFDLIPEIAELLKKRGRIFSWYIIGAGDQQAHIQALIAQHKVEDCVCLVGKKLNPYPYYKSCDIYVQPSRYEGFCLTVAEARVFKKPIIATDFSGAREQLRDGLAGVIVSCEIQEITDAVERLLIDPVRRQYLSVNTNTDFGFDEVNDLLIRLTEGK